LEQNNFVTLTYGYLAVSIAYMLKGTKDSALYYAKKSFEAASEFTETDKPLALANLAKVYSFTGNIDSAYKYEKMSNEVNDSVNKVRIKQLSDYQKFAFNEQLRLKKINDEKTASQNRMMLYGAIGVLLAVIIVALILYRSNRQKQKANQQLETTLADLKSTQAQLIQSEKMASLGELTAGIAHEIQNPLNFVNNFSDVSNELITEMKEELDKGDIAEAKAIANDVQQNLAKINHHGKRADAIVKGMLQHSRSSDGKKEPTDINKLADEYLRLAYHGVRAKDNSFNATLKTDFDNSIGNIYVVSQDIGRVLLNLISNSFYAVNLRGLQNRGGLDNYEPTVWLSTKKLDDKIEIVVSDNGAGIPEEVIGKIFQPFFTTKPTGQATGLGLSLSYDIIKAHQGTLHVESKPSEYAKFTITLPVQNHSRI
jgi:two-component system NtrC family sensor kinase